MIQTLAKPQKRQLTELLLDCPAFKDRGSLQTLLLHLPKHISCSVSNHDKLKTHALNIVDACADYPGGLDALLEELRFFDEKTYQYKAVIAFLKGSGTAVSPSPSEFAGPLHRPPRAVHFIDRTAELDKLLNELHPGKTITLCGPGGVGKTALASEAIWKLAPGNEPPERFPDGIVFHSFYNQPSADLALEWIARMFGGEPKPTPELGARQALSGKTALLFLDGTEDADDLPKVQGIITGGCGLIVTSRNVRDAPDDWQDMKPLKPDDALKLLQEWAEKQIDNHNAAKRICELAGYLPLAVRLAGRYLKQTRETATEYLSWLEDTPLEALDPDEARHRHESVPCLLERSLEQAGEDARAVLALAGQLAMAGFAQVIVSEALKLSAGAMRKAFRELSGYGLVQRSGQRYEVSHALIHTYARERLGVEAEVMDRLVSWYTAFAKAENAKGLAGYHRLDEERGHLLRLLEGCMGREEWESARKLVKAFGNGPDSYLAMQGFWTEWLMVLEQGIKAARASGNQFDEGMFLTHLALAYRSLGEAGKSIALNEQALVIWREIEDRKAEGAALGNLGNAYRNLGQVDKAIEYYERALAIAGEIGDRRGEGADLGNLGNAYRDLGQVEKAIEYCERALAIDLEIGDRRGEGAHLGNLGLAYSNLGQVDKAIEYCERALAIAGEIGDRRNEGVWLGSLGSAYRDLGQVDKAIEYYERALAIAGEIGDRQGEANHSWNLGLIYKETDPARAVELMSVRVEFERELGHPDAEADAKRVAEIKAKISVKS
ncbi:MAG: tetratricopeptide repeat protein [Gammaproteobacteria bacterium]|nr:tetratricopeptide repeat protein [Gammaproteobacteria bacterium]